MSAFIYPLGGSRTFRSDSLKGILNAPVKGLICTENGLNDTFSSLAYHIRLFKQNEWDLSNLYLTHFNYDYLDKYFDFKEVQFTRLETVEKFSFISRFNNGGYTYISDMDLFNYVSIKPEIIEAAPKFPDHIGFHFRCMSEEVTRSADLITKEREFYLDSFKKRYNPCEKYLVVSDSTYFKGLEQQYPNVTCLAPEASLASLQVNRRENTLSAVKNICSLGSCREIFCTRGEFTKLVAFVNKGVVRHIIHC